MIDADRVLRPLTEAEPAIEQLETYESPAALTEALRATCHAVERSLRTLLRSDPAAPDSIRLTAMSADQMSLDTVLTELRRRELISLGLAGRVHELRQAVDRGERGEVRASDADNAEDVVRCVRDEVHRVARRGAGAAGAGAAGSGAATAPITAETAAFEDDPGYIGETRTQVFVRRPLYLIATAVLVVAAAIVAIVLFGGDSEMQQGIEAFREDRKGVAEQHFRTALQQDESNNTARLYLARILREQGRNQEALQLLRAALATDGRDDAVLRELGYLLLQENRAALAADQFRKAVELNGAEPLNWVGAVESMRAAGDSGRADDWLRRAPEAARDMLRRRSQTRATPMP